MTRKRVYAVDKMIFYEHCIFLDMFVGVTVDLIKLVTSKDCMINNVLLTIPFAVVHEKNL